MQTYAAIIALVGVLGAACVAAPPPHKVESRRNATKPWTSYEAFSVDRMREINNCTYNLSRFHEKESKTTCSVRRSDDFMV